MYPDVAAGDEIR